MTIRCSYTSNPGYQRNFTVTFPGARIFTVVTSEPNVLDNWVFKILRIHRRRLNKLVVGLGVQYCLSGDNGFYVHAATLQLCVGTQCIIFQLTHSTSVPRSFRDFLTNERFTFVGVQIAMTRELLNGCEHRLRVGNLVDIRNVAVEKRGLRQGMSMEMLAKTILFNGVAVVKKKNNEVGKSAWDAPWLSMDQVQYACINVFLPFSLGVFLRAWD